MSIRAGECSTSPSWVKPVRIMLAALAVLGVLAVDARDAEPAAAQADCSLAAFNGPPGPCSYGSYGYVTAANGAQLTDVQGITVDLIVPSGMDEPTYCGAQGTPMNCNLYSPPIDNVNGANIRAVQINITYPPQRTSDFVAIGVGKGCLRAGMNSDPMGHCSGINPANNGVFTRIYIDGYAGTYYNQNWYTAVSAGNTVRVMVAKHCLCTNGNWDFYGWVNGSGGYITNAVGQYGDREGRTTVGSESADDGWPRLNMAEQYFQNMTVRLTGSGSWLNVATMGVTNPISDCTSSWLLSPRKLEDFGRC
jgi:hypothetical protein